MSFVSSRDIPEALAERLAKVAHSRGCHVFDGKRGSCEPFRGDHKRHDMIGAQIHLADVCGAFGWSVADLERFASDDQCLDIRHAAADGTTAEAQS